MTGHREKSLAPSLLGNGRRNRMAAWTGVGKTIALGALALAAAAVANYAFARRAEQHNPAEGKFVYVDGVRLHYIERGSGPPIVLLHGNGAMARDFVISGLLDALSADHRVIAFDRPGFGYSERPHNRLWNAEGQAALLCRALATLDVQRPVLVGHSWGTLVALAMALRNPREIAGLALLSGYYFPSLRVDIALMFWPAVPVLGDILRYTVSPLLGRLMVPAIYRRIFAPARIPRWFASEFPIELALRPWQIRASAADTAMMIPAAASMSGRYRALSMPVAIVAGEDDKIIDFRRQPARLDRHLPNSRLRKFPGVGHMVHHSRPEQVALVIQELAGTAHADAAAALS